MSEYAGLKVGIDGHCWLHRGGYACSKELAEGSQTDAYINHTMLMVKMLRESGVEDLIVVLDGASLPAKGTYQRLVTQSF